MSHANRVPGELSVRQSAQLGFVSQIAFSTYRRKLNIASLHLWTWPAIRLGQIVFVFDAAGSPAGYATYAFLSRENADGMRADRIDFLEIGEWNEGLNLWIVDFAAPRGHAQDLVKALRAHLHVHRYCEALKRGPDGSSRRIMRFGRRAGRG